MHNVQYFKQKKTTWRLTEAHCCGRWHFLHTVVLHTTYNLRNPELAIHSWLKSIPEAGMLTAQHSYSDCPAFICWLNNILIKSGMLTISVVNFWLFSVSCWLGVSHISCGWTAQHTTSFKVKMLTILHPLNVKCWVCNASCLLSQLLCGRDAEYPVSPAVNCWLSSILWDEMLTLQPILRDECWVFSVPPGGSDWVPYPSILVG